MIFCLIIGFALYQKRKVPPPKQEGPPLPQKEETIEETLQKLTPAEPKPMTEKERKELEELLKQLTLQ